MPSTMTPFRLSETDRYILSRIAALEGVDNANALRLALREAAEKRNIRPNFLQWVSADGNDEYPVEIATPHTAFERAAFLSIVTAALDRWQNVSYYIKRDDVDEFGWWPITFRSKERGDLWGILVTDPPLSISGRVCVLNLHDQPEVYIDIPDQPYRAAYANPVTTTIGLPGMDKLDAATRAEILRRERDSESS